jgi:simple sugar transport system ATP-binding protein
MTDLLEVRNIGKQYGNVIALRDVSMTVRSGEVTCVLGDNGAGKSTLIKILSGVVQPGQGELLIAGQPVALAGPRDALDRGIATVFQDLAMIPLLSITRNFFLGNEPTKGRWPLRRFDRRTAARITREQMAQMGIAIRNPSQPVGTLSGGERQSVAIARAVYFGAKVLILDEPTSALGIKQAGVVLRYIIRAREEGVGVVFITHNPHHAYPVGDQFVILNRGRSVGNYPRSGISREELIQAMSGGHDLEELSHELELLSGHRPATSALQGSPQSAGPD